MKLLLVDIGNTTADFRLYNSKTEHLESLIRPLSQDKVLRDFTGIKAALDAFGHQFEAIIYVSVVPSLNDLIRSLGELYGIPVLSTRRDLPVKWDAFKLDNLHRLGADFIANFHGFIDQYPEKNAAIISLGTATTLFLIQEGNFIGTTISPGIKASLDALLSKAALLGGMDYKMLPQSLGFNTFESISIGTINGHYYMIQGLLAELKREYSLDKILFTGGNSRCYRDICQKDGITIDEALIFKGLVALYKSHKKTCNLNKSPQEIGRA